MLSYKNSCSIYSDHLKSQVLLQAHYTAVTFHSNVWKVRFPKAEKVLLWAVNKAHYYME